MYGIPKNVLIFKNVKCSHGEQDALFIPEPTLKPYQLRGQGYLNIIMLKSMSANIIFPNLFDWLVAQPPAKQKPC